MARNGTDGMNEVGWVGGWMGRMRREEGLGGYQEGLGNCMKEADRGDRIAAD